MIKLKMMQYLPLKATAESAFEQGDYSKAAEKIKEFANKMSNFYVEGDTSNDALRVAYIGVSNAALILGQVGDSEAIDYAKQTVSLSYKLYKEKQSANNAMYIVSASSTLLKIILSQGNIINVDTSYIESVRSTGRKMAEKLRMHFPNETEVITIINDYDSVDKNF